MAKTAIAQMLSYKTLQKAGGMTHKNTNGATDQKMPMSRDHWIRNAIKQLRLPREKGVIFLAKLHLERSPVFRGIVKSAHTQTQGKTFSEKTREDLI